MPIKSKKANQKKLSTTNIKPVILPAPLTPHQEELKFLRYQLNKRNAAYTLCVQFMKIMATSQKDKAESINDLSFIINEQRQIIDDKNFLLDAGKKTIADLLKTIDDKNKIINARNRHINTLDRILQHYRKNYSNLLSVVIDSIEQTNRAIKQLNCLLKREEWKPTVQPMIEANRLPICKN